MPCFEPVEVPALDFQGRELNDYCQLACLDPCTSVRRNISGGTDPPGVDIPCGPGEWLVNILATISGILPIDLCDEIVNGDYPLAFNSASFIICSGDGPTHDELIKWTLDNIGDGNSSVLVATPSETDILLDFYLYRCNDFDVSPNLTRWQGIASLGNCNFTDVVLSYLSGDGACGIEGVAGDSIVSLVAA